jgi:hypothetical protein
MCMYVVMSVTFVIYIFMYIYIVFFFFILVMCKYVVMSVTFVIFFLCFLYMASLAADATSDTRVPVQCKKEGFCTSSDRIANM